MNAEAAGDLLRLLRGQRWAALATLDGHEPLASMVAYAAEPDLGGLLLHLSHLAAHTRNLLATGRASVVISAPDAGAADPQTLSRLSLNGPVSRVAPEAPDYADLRACYLRALPEAEPRFAFRDFALFRLAPERLRYVGGFARAYSLDRDALRALARQHAPRSLV